ncbi:hypothetical protein BN424_289 [Carnobacterium maltaromaticum LMA28]|uniref:Uncharacterized protein n=1 Tax=Carnobacterium maltaromaticum LMA28 TaxID=1234679 RepID=K8E1S3_CARML|nr:hypothetical protein [Carnobacterium maltaromaticum]CCO09769.2 hypothetical protein BN424_289 [Carnobacterium maltaromaticum LMA28]
MVNPLPTEYEAQHILFFENSENECRTINERVIIRKWPFIRPKAVLLTKDYDALKEKSTYFDLIERENRSLERWFSESVLNKKQVSHKNLTNKIEE